MYTYILYTIYTRVSIIVIFLLNLLTIIFVHKKYYNNNKRWPSHLVTKIFFKSFSLSLSLSRLSLSFSLSQSLSHIHILALSCAATLYTIMLCIYELKVPKRPRCSYNTINIYITLNRLCACYYETMIIKTIIRCRCNRDTNNIEFFWKIEKYFFEIGN